jgi:hypothetical protein
MSPDRGRLLTLHVSDLVAQLRIALYHATRLEVDVTALTDATGDPRELTRALLKRIAWAQDCTVYAHDALHAMLEELEQTRGQWLVPPAGPHEPT